MKSFAFVVTLIWFAVLCPSLGRASDGSVFDRAIPLCRVLTEKGAYAGQMIEMRAVYRLAIHGAVLVGDRSCPSAFVAWRKTEDYLELKEATIVLDQVARSEGKRTADVVLRGKLRIVEQGFECSATTFCSNLVFDASALVAAKVRP